MFRWKNFGVSLGKAALMFFMVIGMLYVVWVATKWVAEVRDVGTVNMLAGVVIGEVARSGVPADFPSVAGRGLHYLVDVAWGGSL